MTHREVIANASTLTVGRVASQVLALVRHVIIGRLLSPEDLGVAAVLMLTSALLEITTQFSVDKVLVQAKDGDEPELQRVSHQFLALRGVLVGVVAVALAVPIAHMFGVTEAAWAFAVFAVAPVINGFRHLDCRRYHRTGRFGPDMGVEVGSQLLVTLAAWPIVAWLGGYTAVLWLLIARAVAGVVASHLVAERAYGWAWNGAQVKRLLSFGWPLAAGGAVMFLILQGDQLVVGGGYSMHQLGLYAVASMLTLALATMLSSISSTLLLPMMSGLQGDSEGFGRVYFVGTLVHAVAGVGIGSALILAGPMIVVALYGGEYREAGVLIGWLGAMQCMRLMRVMPTVAALGKGDTLTAVTTNLWRVSVLPAAVGVAWMGWDLVWIAGVGLFGEVVALVAISIRVRRVHGLHAGFVLGAAVVCTAAMALAGVGAAVLGSTGGAIAIAAFACVSANGACAVAFAWRGGWAARVSGWRERTRMASVWRMEEVPR